MKTITGLVLLALASSATAQQDCRTDIYGEVHCVTQSPPTFQFTPMQPIQNPPPAQNSNNYNWNVYRGVPANQLPPGVSPGMVNYQQQQQQLNAKLCEISHLAQYCN